MDFYPTKWKRDYSACQHPWACFVHVVQLREATATRTERPRATHACSRALHHLQLLKLWSTPSLLPAPTPVCFIEHKLPPLCWVAYLIAVLRVNQDKSLLGKRSYPGTLHRTHTGIFFQHMPKPRGYPARNDGGILTYAGFSGAKPVSQCSLCERCCS